MRDDQAMPFDIVFVQLVLAAVLFLSLGWIGRHSLSSGYLNLSTFARTDAAPAFNLLFRVVGPAVFITIAATALYAFGLDRYVTNIWAVIAFYCLGRLAYIVSFGRVRLVNWPREVLIWTISIGGGWLLYGQIISARETLLPEIKDLKNQFWILLILFVYAAFNSARFSTDGTVRRKTDYLRHSYATSRAKYGSEIGSMTTDALSESLAYSVLMYEQFNRPRWVRLIERMVFPWASQSLGPMQVKTSSRITDTESVRIGVQHLMTLYAAAFTDGSEKAALKSQQFDPVTNPSHRHFVIYKVASGYNKDDHYLSGIHEMHEQLVELLYPNLRFSSPHWSEHLI